MFGAPGAVLLYGAAGACIALPERTWGSLRAGRTILRTAGAFFVGMAVLQAWPGRGFWTGAARHGRPVGQLATMVRQMAHVSQPAVVASWLRAFASFDLAHGFAVNLVVVLFLAVSGVALASARPRAARIGVLLAAMICTADWILVQDFGFFGGVGTDPNSMVPTLVVIVAGYVALVRAPALAHEPTVFDAGAFATADGVSWRARLASNPTYAFRSLAALGALGIVVLGAAPMAAASVNPNADAIVSQATDGNVNFTDSPAASFDLTDQYGQPVSLASLHGRTLAITFLDPVCTVDCPIIAQEFREADAMLGAQARGVDFVAVVANPLYRSVEATRAFDSAEGLSHIGNWLFLTGSVRSLARMWDSYGVQVAVEPGGAMIAHSDLAYVIDGNGDVRAILDADPGPGTASSKSSFAGVLASTVRQVLPAS
jgi:cytochrome oxidase Cu insertion factor (SCO1/SenC/PrrC family)